MVFLPTPPPTLLAFASFAAQLQSTLEKRRIGLGNDTWTVFWKEYGFPVGMELVIGMMQVFLLSFGSG